MNRYAPRLIDTRTHIHICSKICPWHLYKALCLGLAEGGAVSQRSTSAAGIYGIYMNLWDLCGFIATFEMWFIQFAPLASWFAGEMYMSSFHEDSVRVSMMVKSYAHLNRMVIFLMQVSSSNKTRLGKPWETFKPRFFSRVFSRPWGALQATTACSVKGLTPQRDL